jgi:hypothetical protein
MPIYKGMGTTNKIIRAILPAIAISLVALPAVAKNTPKNTAKTIITYPIQMPPPEYDHKFSGTVLITRITGSVKDECSQKTDLGCARHVGNYYIVYIADDAMLTKYKWKYDWALRHEIGHCNGWPGNHPNAKTSPS